MRTYIHVSSCSGNNSRINTRYFHCTEDVMKANPSMCTYLEPSFDVRVKVPGCKCKNSQDGPPNSRVQVQVFICTCMKELFDTTLSFFYFRLSFCNLSCKVTFFTFPKFAIEALNLFLVSSHLCGVRCLLSFDFSSQVNFPQ